MVVFRPASFPKSFPAGGNCLTDVGRDNNLRSSLSVAPQLTLWPDVRRLRHKLGAAQVFLTT
jgi:hypothetical protein